MLTYAAETDTQIMTLCNMDGPIGTCRFIAGEFVINAENAEQQTALAKRIMSRFRFYGTLARKKGITLTKADFFHDLPNYLRNITFHAMRPVRDVRPLLPSHLKEAGKLLYQPIKPLPEYVSDDTN